MDTTNERVDGWISSLCSFLFLAASSRSCNIENIYVVAASDWYCSHVRQLSSMFKASAILYTFSVYDSQILSWSQSSLHHQHLLSILIQQWPYHPNVGNQSRLYYFTAVYPFTILPCSTLYVVELNLSKKYFTLATPDSVE